MEEGRICIKKAGRTAGSKVVVLSKAEKGFVMVEGKALKRKKCNIMHLLPTKNTINLTKNASREEVLKKLGE